jgi:hypothetical protein
MRAGTEVVAVQLDLETDGFTYRKGGAEQTCKPGDWIVNNGGDVYTVDRETFARTYRAEGPGRSERDGAVRTKEGVTRYPAGAYLVFNDEDGQDAYAVTAPSFEAMYEPAD